MHISKLNMSRNSSFGLKGKFALHKAIQKGKNLAKIKKLLLSGANPNVVDSLRRSPLHVAIDVRANIEVFKALLISGAKLEAVNIAQETVLYSAVKNGMDLEIIVLLLQAGANIHCTVGQNTMLHVARSPDIMKELLSHVLCVHAMNSLKQTPLHSTFNRVPRADSLDIIRLLLNHGALINARDHCGATPLHLILLLPHATYNIELVEELLKRGADVHARDLSGRTPLYYLIENSSEMEENCLINELFRLLVLYGSQMNMICGYRSPFNLAYMKNVSCVRFLIKLSILKDPKNIRFYCGLSDGLGTFADECKAEIILLKKDMISNNFSIFDLIINIDGVVPPLYLRKNIDREIVVKYPIYKSIILPKIKLCLEKAKLLVKLKKFHIIIQQGGKNIFFICHCLLKLSDFLPNQDIINLISALKS